MSGTSDITPIPLEIQENQHIYYEYFDFDFSKALADEVLELLEKDYFRSVLVGFDEKIVRNNPDAPIIFAGNHSGMAFPWDGIIFSSMHLKKNNYQLQYTARPLSAPMLSKSTLMNPFLIPNLWKRVGCVDATFRNFETMMYYPDSHVFLYPEGVPGIGKGYNNKYKLQRMSSSFIYMSIKFKTDIIPVYTVNGENINPQTYSLTWLNNLSQKVGVPFVPVGFLTPLLLLQPWLFYFSFPAKLTYVRGSRIKAYEFTDQAAESISKEQLRAYADEVRNQMQAELDAAVEKYGKQPYSVKEHLRIIFQNLKLFPYTVPNGWPLLFAEFEHFWKRKKAGKPAKMRLGWFSTFRIILQNPIVLCYFIPIVGWIPLLIKGYRNNKI
ncbi:MAG: hypothetical protein R2798_07525 [Chitinophagales bacterium]|nr:hypothetical protein [Bacteroidota bacterium]